MTTPRHELVRRAVLVERLSIGWMSIEGGIAVVAGFAARSAALTCFGIDSVIELVAAVVVYRRFAAELRGSDEHHGEVAERRAQVVIAWTLFALAAYVVADSGWSLWKGRHAESSRVGLAVACFALFAMPLLALAKLRLGRALSSRALVGDAKESLACAWLSAATVLGVGANALLGWWWADPMAAIVMVPFLVREGREALEESREGAGGCHDDD